MIDFEELKANYLDESSTRWLYLTLERLSAAPAQAALLKSLADYERKHTAIWKGLLETFGQAVPKERAFLQHRLLAFFARLFGVNAVISLLHKEEVDGIAKYRRQARAWREPEAHEAFKEILPDEVAHEIDIFAVMGHRHFSGGALRSAILGINDGLGSMLAMVAGVAAASSSSRTVTISGVAGLVAGAISMAASNYISVKAERDIYSSQAELQKQAIDVAPETKRDQLEEAYRRKGLSVKEAQDVVSRLTKKPHAFLLALLSEEGALLQDGGESPLAHAAYTGLSFAVFGAIPVAPFLFLDAPRALAASVIVTGLTLFLAGLLRALSSLDSFLKSGFEMFVIGMGSAAVTYLVGLAVGGVIR